jgi:hypothetical protein
MMMPLSAAKTPRRDSGNSLPLAVIVKSHGTSHMAVITPASAIAASIVFGRLRAVTSTRLLPMNRHSGSRKSPS